MATILLSREVAARVGDELRAVAERAGAPLEIVHHPEGAAERPPAEVLARIDCCFISREVRFSPDLMPKSRRIVLEGPAMRWVHFASSGASQHTWLLPAIERGVTVTTSVGNNAEPLAQCALLGLLMLGRRGLRWVSNQREHRWETHLGDPPPADIAGQTLVIVGLGSIGRHLARMALGLRMRVVGVRRSPPGADDPPGVEIRHSRELPALAGEADWLALCLPATAENKGLLSRDLLARMKPSAHVINIARGDIADEAALVDALRGGRIAGAYLDVFATEPLPADSPLWDMPNVLLSTHNASVSAGNARRATGIFLDNFDRFVRGRPLRNALAL